MPVRPSYCLSIDEQRAVVATAKCYGSPTGRLRLAIVRLAMGCGMRVSEVRQLSLRDVHLDGDKPHIIVRASISKSKRDREVPLREKAVLDDLREWLEFRSRFPGDTVVCGVQRNNSGKPLSRQSAANLWLTALRKAGIRKLSIHKGRHSYCSRLLANGIPPQNVSVSAGHSSVRTTLDTYTHVVSDVEMVDGF